MDALQWPRCPGQGQHLERHQNSGTMISSDAYGHAPAEVVPYFETGSRKKLREFLVKKGLKARYRLCSLALHICQTASALLMKYRVQISGNSDLILQAFYLLLLFR